MGCRASGTPPGRPSSPATLLQLAEAGIVLSKLMRGLDLLLCRVLLFRELVRGGVLGT